MIFKDYYKILELDSNKVTMEQIKTAYREQAKKYHPDVNIGNKLVEERFKDINEAYRVLSATATKRKYDRMWNMHVGNKNKKVKYEESKRTKDSVFSDFFNLFFGVVKDEANEKINKKVAVKGEDVETAITISIIEAFFGITKKISLRTIDGKMKTFSVKVPAGIRDGEKIRLIGQGKAGENAGKNGDLFIRIEIEPSQIFHLEGYDLSTDLFLTPSEAALGTRANLQGIDETVLVYIPAGIQSGEKLRIPGKGYKDGKGGRGDLIAIVKVMVPKKLTEEERELYEKLKEISNFNPRNKVI